MGATLKNFLLTSGMVFTVKKYFRETMICITDLLDLCHQRCATRNSALSGKKFITLPGRQRTSNWKGFVFYGILRR